MRKAIVITVTLAIIGMILYLSVDTLFELFTNREIVIGLMVAVVAGMLYFSLKPCFTKKNK